MDQDFAGGTKNLSIKSNFWQAVKLVEKRGVMNHRCASALQVHTVPQLMNNDQDFIDTALLNQLSRCLAV